MADICSVCGEHLGGMGYNCSYCGLKHCSNHRLPEKHDCAALNSTSLASPTPPNVSSSPTKTPQGSRLASAIWSFLKLGAVIAILVYTSIAMGAVPADGIPGGDLASETGAAASDTVSDVLNETEEETSHQPTDANTASQERDSESTSQLGFNISYTKLQTHQRINDERTPRGENALAWNDELSEVAREHSEDMAQRDFFAHQNPDGEEPWDRAACNAGENIAQTYVNQRVERSDGSTFRISDEDELAESLTEQWMNSPGHRENILRSRWDLSGVGIYITEDDTVYATQLFCENEPN